MSIGIATLGMFGQTGGGTTVVEAGGVIQIPEEKLKPTIKITRITSTDEELNKSKVEIISISGE